MFWIGLAAGFVVLLLLLELIAVVRELAELVRFTLFGVYAEGQEMAADKGWYTVTVFGPPKLSSPDRGEKRRVELDVYARTQREAEGRAEGWARGEFGGVWIAGLVKGPRASR